MITFTKEQLIASAHARIEFAEMMLAGELEPLKERTWSIELELARIALASLEAEAVAVRARWKDEGTGRGDWKYHDIAYRDSLMADETRESELIYTAPPAPVSVPTFEEWCKRTEQKPVGWVHDAMKEAYDACRAAMLQGADGNSPVIPDSWVACSERMPDPESEYRICAYTPTPHEDVRFRFVPASLFKSVCRDATHWQYMLPPAAPQQEAKNV